MRVLGIDHGARTGFAVLNDGKLERVGFKMISSGSDVVDGSKFGYATGRKYRNIYNLVDSLIEEYKPDWVALEEPKDRVNGNTSQTLIGYYTIALLAAFNKDVSISECHPKTVKKYVTGNGNADKELVAEWMSHHLECSIELLTPAEYYKVGAKAGQIKKYNYDESDAAALAYYTWQLHRKDV